MATVPHFTSGLGLRKFQTDGFLLTRVYKTYINTEYFKIVNYLLPGGHRALRI